MQILIGLRRDHAFREIKKFRVFLVILCLPPTTDRAAARCFSLLRSQSTWKAVCFMGVAMPHSTRPRDRRSTVATFSAMRAGVDELLRSERDAKTQPDVLR